AVAAEHVRFVQHDLRMPWPVAAASIDVAVGNLVLEHIESLAPVFAEAARVVRPGGQLFICELHPARQRRGGQAHFTYAATGVAHAPESRSLRRRAMRESSSATVASDEIPSRTARSRYAFGRRQYAPMNPSMQSAGIGNGTTSVFPSSWAMLPIRGKTTASRA